MPRVPIDAVSRINAHVDTWTPLDDEKVRDLAVACWRNGQPVIEIAQALDLCAETLAALLGADA